MKVSQSVRQAGRQADRQTDSLDPANQVACAVGLSGKATVEAASPPRVFPRFSDGHK